MTTANQRFDSKGNMLCGVYSSDLKVDTTANADKRELFHFPGDMRKRDSLAYLINDPAYNLIAHYVINEGAKANQNVLHSKHKGARYILYDGVLYKEIRRKIYHRRVNENDTY